MEKLNICQIQKDWDNAVTSRELPAANLSDDQCTCTLIMQQLTAKLLIMSKTHLLCILMPPIALPGEFCLEDVYECSRSPSPCKNGGTCHNKGGGYQCICVNGWEGDNCDVNVGESTKFVQFR